MNDKHDLSDSQCDLLVALTMDKLAAKHSDQYGTTHALDLNPSITEHHSLRRSIVRAAYEIGKLAGSTEHRLECAKPLLTPDQCDGLRMVLAHYAGDPRVMPLAALLDAARSKTPNAELTERRKASG